jgi:hypothetical protein
MPTRAVMPLKGKRTVKKRKCEINGTKIFKIKLRSQMG